MLEVLGIQDAEKIVPTEDDHKPKDPVSENMALITGEPVKAFLYQDHEAHITTHIAAAKNPEIQEMMKQNPNAKAVMAAMAAHVSEHLAFAYRAKIEKELGVELPGPEEVLPEDIELRLSRIVSVAAAQLTGKAQRMQKAEEDAEKQKDPIVIQAEKEHALEEKKALAKAKYDFEKLADDREKVKSHERIEGAKIGAKFATDQLHGKTEADKITSKERLEGVRVGMEMAQSVIEDGANE